MLTSEMLEQAKTRLMENGWTQQVYGKREGPNCTVGALRWTIEDLWGLRREWYKGRLDDLLKARAAAQTYLTDALNASDICEVEIWNDQKHRSFSDIIDLYDCAIQLAKEAEREDSR